MATCVFDPSRLGYEGHDGKEILLFLSLQGGHARRFAINIARMMTFTNHTSHDSRTLVRLDVVLLAQPKAKRPNCYVVMNRRPFGFRILLTLACTKSPFLKKRI